MDHLSSGDRSKNMSQIHSKNTKPEILVRSYLHQTGHRFRLHGRVSKKEFDSGILPGKPDIVLAGKRTVIFVNGCFWHQHSGCKRATMPKSNVEYWEKKFQNNIERDTRNIEILKEMGWKVIIIWECEAGDSNKMMEIIEKEL